jgi:hypothetical protein
MTTHVAMLRSDGSKIYSKILLCWRSLDIGKLKICFNVQRRILEAVQSGMNTTLTTLDVVRDTFTDRLADFHCLDKTIYLLNLTGSNS